jgi:hypothetical protein
MSSLVGRGCTYSLGRGCILCARRPFSVIASPYVSVRSRLVRPDTGVGTRATDFAPDERSDVVSVRLPTRLPPTSDKSSIDEAVEHAPDLPLASVAERGERRPCLVMLALKAPQRDHQPELGRCEVEPFASREPPRQRPPGLAPRALGCGPPLVGDEAVAGARLLVLARRAHQLPGSVTDRLDVVVDAVDGVGRAAPGVAYRDRALGQVLRPDDQPAHRAPPMEARRGPGAGGSPAGSASPPSEPLSPDRAQLRVLARRVR